MNLRLEQDLIARMVTNARPGVEVRLTNDDLAPDQITLFTESLFQKRFHEVAKLLPLTRQALGGKFAEEFRQFHSTFNPKTSKRHVEDSIAFCGYVAKNHSTKPHIRSVASCEAAKLRFFAYEKRFSFCMPAGTGRILSFALWLRIGRRVRFVMR
jgi:hypothetical protein